MNDYSGRSTNAVVAAPENRDAVAHARHDAENAASLGDYGRRLAGLSYPQISQRTGISAPRCEALLDGSATPQSGELAKLSKAIHVPQEQLFDAATDAAKARYRARF